MEAAPFSSIADRLRAILDEQPVDLARAALVIAEVEYPTLDAGRELAMLDRLGTRAAERLESLTGAPLEMRLETLSRLLFDEEGFAGNEAHYGDFRNSLLNVVLERRLGIPLTLALVYMEVAGRAGLAVRGIAFPGHFLLSAETSEGARIILDPFDHGAVLDEPGCRQLLARQMGDAAEYSPALLAPCSSRHLVVRLLNNLKRAYVEVRSFAHAWLVTDLIVSIDPSIVSERRDRGLLAYHLEDFSAALSDLEVYLHLTEPGTNSAREERRQLDDHVNALRRRVASLN